jgi:hypothetical protein
MRQREIQNDTESHNASPFNFYSPIRLLKAWGGGGFHNIFKGVGKEKTFYGIVRLG